jgi:hypothetical protein
VSVREFGAGQPDFNPKTPLIPANAGTQIHSERLVGFTWVPAFAGMSGGVGQVERRLPA